MIFGKWFESRSLSRLCGLIVWVRVVPRRTLVGDIDRRIDNLSGSHHQSHDYQNHHYDFCNNLLNSFFARLQVLSALFAKHPYTVPSDEFLPFLSTLQQLQTKHKRYR